MVTVNGCALIAVPPGVVTVTKPVVAPCGTVVVSEVAETLVMMALVVLNFTVVLPGPLPFRLVPVMVTTVPTGPVIGVNPAIVGAAGVIVKVAVAGSRPTALAVIVT